MQLRFAGAAAYRSGIKNRIVAEMAALRDFRKVPIDWSKGSPDSGQFENTETKIEVCDCDSEPGYPPTKKVGRGSGREGSVRRTLDQKKLRKHGK